MWIPPSPQSGIVHLNLITERSIQWWCRGIQRHRNISLLNFFLVFISSEISNGPACANFLTNTNKVQNTFSSIQDCKTKEKKSGVKNSPSLLAFDPETVLDYAGFVSRRCDVSSAVLQSKHCTVTSRRLFRLDVSHSASSVLYFFGFNPFSFPLEINDLIHLSSNHKRY